MIRRYFTFGFLFLGMLLTVATFVHSEICAFTMEELSEPDIRCYDIIDTVEVVDSLSESSSNLIRPRDVELNPCCLCQDLYKYALATEPLVNVYGPFSAQLSVNGCRPADVCIRVDNVLKLYKKDSYHNLFSLPRTDIFGARLNKRGFPALDLTTDPREGHGLSLGLLDFSVYSHWRFHHLGCFHLVRISWLDQIMKRWYDEEYSIFPSFEEYYLKIHSDTPGDLGPELNFWFVDQDSYFKTDGLDGVIEESGEAYHTSAMWKSDSRSMACWYGHNLVIRDSFIKMGLSLSDTRRKDVARGKSGIVSQQPDELNSYLFFRTFDVNAALECFTYISELEINHGINIGRIVNRMKVDSRGIYYPAIYTIQRGDEYTPDALMAVNQRTAAFQFQTWFKIRKEISRFSFQLGVTSQHRTRFPLVLGPELKVDVASAVGRWALFTGRSQQFPGAERAHVSMYPLEGSRVEIDDYVGIGLKNSLLDLNVYYARLYDLFDPMDENSLFSGEYADGYSFGFECRLRKSLTIFDLDMSYGFGRSRLTREGIAYPSTYDPGSKGTCSIRCRLYSSISFTLAGDCSQGQRVTPLAGRELSEKGYQPVWGRPNSARLPMNYGVSFGTTIRFTRSFEVSLFVTDIPGRKFAIVYDDWYARNYVKTHWYGGMKLGYDF